VSSGWLICVIVQNFNKIGQTVLEILRFFDFQDGCLPPSWIFKNLIFWTWFTVWRANMCQRAKCRRNRWNYCWDIATYPFLRWWPSSILDLWGKFWDDPQWEFGGVYHCAKFGWNHISHFDNTKVWIFCTFGLKTPIHAHFWLFWG